MLDEIDDILYQWKQTFLTREAAEDRIINVVLAHQEIKREVAAEVEALKNEIRHKPDEPGTAQ